MARICSHINVMSYLLSGDIGGTKTLLQLTAEAGVPLLQRYYVNASYAGLAEIMEEFLAEAAIRDIDGACFAVAGPVNGSVVRLTNLPWQIDSDALARHFAIRQVSLINDFVAVGHGIATLQKQDLYTLQRGTLHEGGERMVVGAGTGLGVAWLSHSGGRYHVHASEGGHMDFAPVDDMQILLLRYLRQSHAHVSYERIVSGPGLLAIFEFIRDAGLAAPSHNLLAAMREGDAAAAIADFSMRGDEEIALMVVELFLSVYGAFVGNMALAALPLGGVYIAGGIAAKMVAQIQRGVFMRSFLAKGRFAELLGSLPVHIVLDTHVGLRGADVYIRQHLQAADRAN
jgi:glucokinase